MPKETKRVLKEPHYTQKRPPTCQKNTTIRQKRPTNSVHAKSFQASLCLWLWHDAARALRAEAREVVSLRARQDSRRARRLFVAWLALRQYHVALSQVLEGGQRERRRGWMRAWCVHTLRAIALRDAARCVPVDSLFLICDRSLLM